ncbi:MAG: phosphoribosylformylglycinamidine cyclo-ligase [Desulfomonile tiedjei]|uniref:Phosphoribosylformylglycinamidine cyclo-ligase n=1 Tax=Desulfomonile tiedjei TaxID=2358 RepID=A0A9D6V462_9BACT|nr:phosphoribosylformylglycinamidine cyclo-ligase [Desulfomonile tiedjei]
MSEKITYKDAGVDVELADKIIGSLSDRIKSTFRPEVMGKMGGFAAMFRPQWTKYKDPVLVSATDGVGTKLKMAFLTGIHDTVGIDLVAMNVNDLLVTGAEPLFFLDYFATGALQEKTIRDVISGIARGCEQAGCSLIGGETAEMPDFYAQGEYDLAGFCVGIVDRPEAIDGSGIRPGDVVLGVASSGLHSNGFSLVRKVFLERLKYSMDTYISEFGKPLGEELLCPTSIYVKPVLKLCGQIEVKGMAHITGGGFIGNIPRVLPESCAVSIQRGSWEIPPVFRVIQREASLDDSDMYLTFNMGVGLVIIVASERADSAAARLTDSGLRTWIIGEVKPRDKGKDAIILD